MMFFGNSGVARSTDLVVKEGLINSQDNLDRLLATFRRKIDDFGSTSMGFGRAKTAGPPAVNFEGLWM